MSTTPVLSPFRPRAARGHAPERRPVRPGAALSFLLLVLLLGLCACVRQAPMGDVAAPQAADALWGRYAAYCAAQDAPATAQRPYRLQLSLRYGAEGDTRRVTALLWGNDDQRMRLDVSAGVGVTVANIMDDGDYFMVYAPGEQRAYYHHGRQKPLLSVGVPMPLGVGDLAALLNGRFGQVFGVAHKGQAVARTGGIAYTLDGGRLSGTLLLDAAGLPMLWQENGTAGWSLQLTYDEGAPPLPRKLEITHPKGQRAIVLVKERDFPATPFTENQLRLTIPEDTPVLPIKQFRQAQG